MLQRYLQDYWEENDWKLVHRVVRKGRAKSLFSFRDLALAPESKAYLESSFPQGLYKHQAEGLKQYLSGQDLVLATGTASGKSAVFYAAAIDLLGRNPKAKILAVYPLKALGREQEERWRSALLAAGFPGDSVARIDGEVHTSKRPAILKKAAVVIVTPDILHAWMVPNVNDTSVRRFVAAIGMLVVDEVHVYTGVFGSNAAYLFRRLEYANTSLGGRYQYIAASATIRDPAGHLRSLFGRDFAMIDESDDTSEQHELQIFMVDPPAGKDLLSATSEFLHRLALQEDCRFITFVDSRKQTEHIATIISRNQEKVLHDEEAFADHLTRLNVLPYRAGFEEGDRELIQSRLSSGDLCGVISTSALELGINIPHLDVGVLVGVPRSGTSFQQRIGRVGREKPGLIVIINSGDLHSEAVFSNPESILHRPLAESALYLENPRVQYIHAMCLARPGGENDRLKDSPGGGKDYDEHTDWPQGFVNLCRQENAGTVEVGLQNMKIEAGEVPHHTYPLRDIESQFRIEFKQGPNLRNLGSISYGQMMREAYPGAVYYYTTIPYRVCQVLFGPRCIRVRKEKFYTTSPILLPVQVYPNLTGDNILQAGRYGRLAVAEANLQVRESVVGVKERRGPNETDFSYPVNKAGIIYTQPYFTRNYFTTGVVLHHPDFNLPGIQVEKLAQLFYECFLIENAFERKDINCAAGRLKVEWNQMEKGDRFLAIYDQTYGSLRLTGKLLDEGVIARVINLAKILADEADLFEINDVGKALLNRMEAGMSMGSQDLSPVRTKDPNASHPDYDRIPVILPGSPGLLVTHFNEEFSVTDVFFSPKDGKLKYRGRRSSQDPSVESTVLVDALIPVPGESETGFYYLETGEIRQERSERIWATPVNNPSL